MCPLPIVLFLWTFSIPPIWGPFDFRAPRQGAPGVGEHFWGDDDPGHHPEHTGHLLHALAI